MLEIKKIDWPLVLVLLIAAFFRFFLLDLRPAHHDEGVFGWFLDQMEANGFYRYDPTNYHGPLHYYVLFLFYKLLGRSDWAIRLPDAIISFISVYWILLFSKFFNRSMCLLAALAMAVSPAMTYFGRYAFQEAFLVFYTMLTLWGIIGLLKEGKKKYLWSVGLGSTLMILTKETSVIHIACFVIAWVYLFIWEKIYPSESMEITKQEWNLKDLVYVTLASIVLIIFFYSGTFFNPSGIQGLLQTFQAWCSTGIKEGGHAKPFIYWAKLIFRYEYFTLIGAIAAIRYLSPSDRFIRYISIYGLGVFLAYSIVPYKTVWCIINILWPFYFVFGHFVDQSLKKSRNLEMKALCLLLFIASIYTASKINFVDYANSKEPYVYVHTFVDMERAVEPIFRLVESNSDGYNLVGHVMRQDEWPLPWTFGDFTMIGYYGPDLKPQSYDADFLIVESKRVNEVEEKLSNRYYTDIFTLRDAQDSSKLYLSYEKFKYLYPERTPEFEPILREDLSK